MEIAHWPLPCWDSAAAYQTCYLSSWDKQYYILSKHCQRNDLPRCLYPPPGHHVLGRQPGQQPVTGSGARLAQSERDPGDQSSLASAQDLGAAPTKLKWSLHWLKLHMKDECVYWEVQRYLCWMSLISTGTLFIFTNDDIFNEYWFYLFTDCPKSVCLSFYEKQK